MAIPCLHFSAKVRNKQHSKVCSLFLLSSSLGRNNYIKKGTPNFHDKGLKQLEDEHAKYDDCGRDLIITNRRGNGVPANSHSLISKNDSQIDDQSV